MNIQSVSIGGWFQRTELHLYEIFDFLTSRTSPMEDLQPAKLKKLHTGLDIRSFEFKVGAIGMLEVQTNDEIRVRIHEDGLITLKLTTPKDIHAGIAQLRGYYEKKLSPVMSYLFSLGAPVPKELAKIKTIYPYFITLKKCKQADIDSLLKDFDQPKTFDAKHKTYDVYRGDKLYIINNKGEKEESIDHLIEERVFIREFKTQMHRYLNLHRKIWERIDKVKERQFIRGGEVSPFLAKLEEYKKTINLIDTRINQMGIYIGMRKNISRGRKDFIQFQDLLEFKYDTLSNTLQYIQHIWTMTKNYLNEGIEVFGQIESAAGNNSISNLTVVTSMGVGAGLLNLFTNDFPTLSWTGVAYFASIAMIGWVTKKVMSHMSRNKKYTIDIDDATLDL